MSVQGPTDILKAREDSADMGEMVRPCLGPNNNIIYISKAERPTKAPEQRVHAPLKEGRCVLKAEGDTLELPLSFLLSHKRGQVAVSLVDLELMVPLISIHGREKFSTRNGR